MVASWACEFSAISVKDFGRGRTIDWKYSSVMSPHEVITSNGVSRATTLTKRGSGAESFPRFH
jgi:hypothetical protein